MLPTEFSTRLRTLRLVKPQAGVQVRVQANARGLKSASEKKKSASGPPSVLPEVVPPLSPVSYQHLELEAEVLSRSAR